MENIALEKALAAFDFGGQVISCERFGGGHINDTFCVVVDGGEHQRYILQRISSAAFKKPHELMENVVGGLYLQVQQKF